MSERYTVNPVVRGMESLGAFIKKLLFWGLILVLSGFALIFGFVLMIAHIMS